MSAITVLLFLYALTAGLISGWRRLKRNRQGEPPQETLLSWQAVPAPALRVDPLIAVSLSLHAAGILALGGLGLVATLAAWDMKENWFLHAWDALALFLLLAFLILTWDLIGRLLAQPLMGWLKTPANFAIAEPGLYYGAYLMPWGQFSHFSLDPAHELVRLHPASCPGLATFSLKHPDPDGYSRLIQRVGSFLPAAPPPEAPGTRSRAGFFGLLMLTVYPSLLLGTWLAGQPGVLTALYFGLAVFAASRLGTRVIQRYT